MAESSRDSAEGKYMGEMAVEVAGFRAQCVDLSDDAIVGALREMPGYIDVTVGDLREIYRRAYPRAVEQSLRGLRARDLMRIGVRPARPDMALVDAARLLAEQAVCSLPVVDDSGRVVGLFATADLLHRLHAGSTLQLLLRLIDDSSSVDRAALAVSVSNVMRSSAVAVTEDAGFQVIAAAFAQDGISSMPVTDARGRLLGILDRERLDAVLLGNVGSTRHREARRAVAIQTFV
jgi:CBS-domain-containing membrane protein